MPAKETVPKRFLSAVLVFVFGCATLQFTRYYTKSTDFYLNMAAYLSGHERLPFQERIFPIAILRPMFHSRWLMDRMAHSNGAFTPELGPFYILSLISLIIAGVYTQRLYALVSVQRSLSFLVYPVFLFAMMWSYAIHSEADYSYPYDLPSVAFFAAGLFYIYKRSYAGLFIVVLIGTFNRETTLFLIVLYLIDSASRAVTSPRLTSAPLRSAERFFEVRERFDLRLVHWSRLALLSVVWVGIKSFLAHLFAGNSNAENFLRIDYNLARLSPRLLPALLNICGYTIPVIVIFSRFLKPVRFQNYLWVLPVWIGIMFCSGVLVETRIYGELCPFAAVALVLIAEESVNRSKRKLPIAQDRQESQARMAA